MTKDQFDASVGRYVLLYQPDPHSTIRSLLRSVKPDGIVVFHEFDCPGLRASYPACPLFDQVNMLVDAVFRRGGASAFGRRLGKTLLDAGLPSQLWRQKSSSVDNPILTSTLGLPKR